MSNIKPLVVFDIETTGLDKSGNNWIIQFAAIKVDRETNNVIDSINELINPPCQFNMSVGAYLKHNIHPDDLIGKPTFKELSQRILDFFEGCDILTYNGTSFDIPFLVTEFEKAGIKWSPLDYVCYDACAEEKVRSSYKLENAFKRYTGMTMEQAGLEAHDAYSDVKACYSVFVNQNQTAEVKPMVMITDDNSFVMDKYNGEDVVVPNFGKYRGVPLRMVNIVEPSYIRWMMAAVSEKSREIIRRELA